MANRANRNNVEESAEDIHNDVSQLADTLEEVLKSWGSDAKDEAAQTATCAINRGKASAPQLPLGYLLAYC